MKANLIFFLRCFVTTLVLVSGSLLMGTLAMLTLFQYRSWYADVILKQIGLVILKIWGVTMNIHPALPHSYQIDSKQVVYISNHTSTIDMFVLIALGLPNTRFFLSGFLRKTGVIGLIGYLIGVFWTVPQQYPERRRAIFQGAERVLKKTGESVFLSPEGERVITGQIGHFNKGAFHLAYALQAPIIPIYIAIPKAMDPGLGLHVRPGCVDVFFKPAISTTAWRLDDIVMHKEQVRDLYLQWHKELQQHG
jgi:1-acyl-sn-glycerol-3-phosphate acyltransferase